MTRVSSGMQHFSYMLSQAYINQTVSINRNMAEMRPTTCDMIKLDDFLHMIRKWGFVSTVHQSLINWPLQRGYFGSWDVFQWPIVVAIVERFKQEWPKGGPKNVAAVGKRLVKGGRHKCRFDCKEVQGGVQAPRLVSPEEAYKPRVNLLEQLQLKTSFDLPSKIIANKNKRVSLIKQCTAVQGRFRVIESNSINGASLK